MTNRRRSSFPRIVALLSFAALAAPIALLTAAETEPSISVFFETQFPYFYEGDPLPVAMTVKNVSDATVDNSKGIDLLGGFRWKTPRGAS